MRTYTEMGGVLDDIEEIIERAEKSELYMPAIVTAMRLEADKLSERFPSDVND